MEFALDSAHGVVEDDPGEATSDLPRAIQQGSQNSPKWREAKNLPNGPYRLPQPGDIRKDDILVSDYIKLSRSDGTSKLYRNVPKLDQLQLGEGDDIVFDANYWKSMRRHYGTALKHGIICVRSNNQRSILENGGRLTEFIRTDNLQKVKVARYVFFDRNQIILVQDPTIDPKHIALASFVPCSSKFVDGRKIASKWKTWSPEPAWCNFMVYRVYENSNDGDTLLPSVDGELSEQKEQRRSLLLALKYANKSSHSSPSLQPESNTIKSEHSRTAQTSANRSSLKRSISDIEGGDVSDNERTNSRYFDREAKGLTSPSSRLPQYFVNPEIRRSGAPEISSNQSRIVHSSPGTINHPASQTQKTGSMNTSDHPKTTPMAGLPLTAPRPEQSDINPSTRKFVFRTGFVGEDFLIRRYESINTLRKLEINARMANVAKQGQALKIWVREDTIFEIDVGDEEYFQEILDSLRHLPCKAGEHIVVSGA